jgi:glycosyltransferase involved in cell wall biosynthesis
MNQTSVPLPGSLNQEPFFVVIPALNEATTVRRVVKRVLAIYPQAHVVVVDDGSSDGTATEALTAGATVLSHPFNCGYGTALHTGLLHASRSGASIVVFLDADGQHEVGDIAKLLEPLRAGTADLALGSRFLPESRCYRMPLSRRCAAWLLAKALSSLTRFPIRDTTTGFQALSPKTIRIYLEMRGFPDKTPDADMILYAHMRGCRVFEVAVTMHEDETGDSMHSLLKSMFYLPKMFVSLLSIVLAYNSWKK